MFILIAGGGRVGYYLARDLLEKGHEVSLIEKNAAVCAQINDELGSITVNGDASEPQIMEKAGIGRADIVVAATGDDEDNLIITQVAKTKFNVPFSIARIINLRNKEIFLRLGVDATVSQTELIFSMIEDAMAYKGVIATLPIIHGVDVEVEEISIPDNSPAAGKALRELPIPKNSNIAMIIRGKEAIVPNGDTKIQPKDLAICIVKHESVAEFSKLLLGDKANLLLNKK